MQEEAGSSCLFVLNSTLFFLAEPFLRYPTLFCIGRAGGWKLEFTNRKAQYEGTGFMIALYFCLSTIRSTSYPSTFSLSTLGLASPTHYIDSFDYESFFSAKTCFYSTQY